MQAHARRLRRGLADDQCGALIHCGRSRVGRVGHDPAGDVPPVRRRLLRPTGGSSGWCGDHNGACIRTRCRRRRSAARSARLSSSEQRSLDRRAAARTGCAPRRVSTQQSGHAPDPQRVGCNFSVLAVTRHDADSRGHAAGRYLWTSPWSSSVRLRWRSCVILGLEGGQRRPGASRLMPRSDGRRMRTGPALSSSASQRWSWVRRRSGVHAVHRY
jgi:hypothetical protein